MSYEERLQTMIDKGAITPEQAKQFSQSLERLTPAGATLVFRKPVSLLKLSLCVLGLLVVGTVIIGFISSPHSAASETIQNVATSLNQAGATGDMGSSATTMLSMFMLLSLPLAAVLFFLASLYNQLVGYDEDIKKTGAFISNALTNKRELIPQLEGVMQTALTYEETLQHSITETRSNAAHNLQQGIAEAKTNAEKPLAGLLNAVVEAYPQIKALESVNQLQTEMARVEHNILIACNIHAEAIADFNTTSRSVFGGFVAGMYGFKPQFQASI